MDAALLCSAFVLDNLCLTTLHATKTGIDDGRCNAGPLSRSVVLLCSHSLFTGTYGLVINKLMDSQHHPGAKRSPTDHNCRPVARAKHLQLSLQLHFCSRTGKSRS